MSTTSPNMKQLSKPSKKRRYLTKKTLGRGAFGTVYLAKEEGTNNMYAVKETFQDSRYKNREAGILKLVSKHPSIVSVEQMFYTNKKDGRYLNIVMEYLQIACFRTYERRKNFAALAQIDLMRSY